MAPPPDLPALPDVPADVRACLRQPVEVPDSDLDVGEVERLWKTDRARLVKVNGCLWRLLCQAQDVRRDIGGVDTKACEAAAPKGAKVRGRRK